MKIFIGWSGNRSKEVAKILHWWLPNVVQSLEVWMSEEDIKKGSKWILDLSSELEAINFGIICLTPENLDSRWLLFETGALAKKLNESFVSPILLDLNPKDLLDPFSHFQHTLIEKEDIHRLIKTINSLSEQEQLGDNKLDESFEKWWPDFIDKIQAITLNTLEASEPRSQDELIEEILLIVRQIERSMTFTGDPLRGNPMLVEIKVAMEALHKIIKELEIFSEKDLSVEDRAFIDGLIEIAMNTGKFLGDTYRKSQEEANDVLHSLHNWRRAYELRNEKYNID